MNPTTQTSTPMTATPPVPNTAAFNLSPPQTPPGVNMGLPQKPLGNTYQVPGRDVTLTDSDLNVLRPTLYGEVSNRPYDKKDLEANVITNTAINRMVAYAKNGMQKSMADVLSMPNQYQAYNGEQYKNYSNPNLTGPDSEKRDQVNKIVDGIIASIKDGTFKDNTNNSMFYKHIGNNPDTATIQYDDTRSLFKK